MEHSQITGALGKAALAMTLLFAVCGNNAAQSSAAYKPPECVDNSSHKVRFVEVAPGVELEVLDWGGEETRKSTMVLLTGLGDNAHVYDEFALQFTDYLRVIGITRRGFGQSSKPEGGYDLASRVRDIIAVLKALNISQAVFVGHSLAGDELSMLGSAYPNHVEKLVYLDAYDDYFDNSQLPALPPPPFTAADFKSLERFQAASARLTGTRKTNADVCDSFVFGASGEIVGSTTPADVQQTIFAGSGPVDFKQIHAPRLGIFKLQFIDEPRQPYYAYLDIADRAEFDKNWPASVAWQQDAIQRFESRGRNGIKPIVFTLPLPEPVVQQPTAVTYHYIYINNEAFVVEEMRKFLGIPLVVK